MSDGHLGRLLWPGLWAYLTTCHSVSEAIRTQESAPEEGLHEPHYQCPDSTRVLLGGGDPRTQPTSPPPQLRA